MTFDAVPALDLLRKARAKRARAGTAKPRSAAQQAAAKTAGQKRDARIVSEDEKATAKPKRSKAKPAPAKTDTAPDVTGNRAALDATKVMREAAGVRTLPAKPTAALTTLQTKVAVAAIGAKTTPASALRNLAEAGFQPDMERALNTVPLTGLNRIAANWGMPKFGAAMTLPQRRNAVMARLAEITGKPLSGASGAIKVTGADAKQPTFMEAVAGEIRLPDNAVKRLAAGAARVTLQGAKKADLERIGAQRLDVLVASLDGADRDRARAYIDARLNEPPKSARRVRKSQDLQVDYVDLTIELIEKAKAKRAKAAGAKKPRSAAQQAAAKTAGQKRDARVVSEDEKAAGKAKKPTKRQAEKAAVKAEKAKALSDIKTTLRAMRNRPYSSRPGYQDARAKAINTIDASLQTFGPKAVRKLGNRLGIKGRKGSAGVANIRRDIAIEMLNRANLRTDRAYRQ